MKEHIYCPDSGLEQEVVVEQPQQSEDDHTHDLHRLADDGPGIEAHLKPGAKYMLLVKGFQVQEIKEYQNAAALHAAWYYWSNCTNSEGRYTYKVRCWVEIDPKEL